MSWFIPLKFEHPSLMLGKFGSLVLYASEQRLTGSRHSTDIIILTLIIWIQYPRLTCQTASKIRPQFFSGDTMNIEYGQLYQ